MILLDANLLLYAYNTSFDEHTKARAWLERAVSGPTPVGLPWATILAFLRISTNPRAFPTPFMPREAAAVITQWLAYPMVVTIAPGERHWEILSGLLTSVQARGARVADAHLAALAIEHGATLCTTDRDFRLFPGLQVLNPLQ